MRFLKFAVLAALFAIPVSSVNAGALGSLVQSEVVKVEDDDFEIGFGIDINGNPVLGPLGKGSFLMAIAQFPTTYIASDLANPVFEGTTETDMITAVTLVKILEDPVEGSAIGKNFAEFELGGVSGAEWKAITEAFMGVGSGIEDVADGTAIVAFLDPISAPDSHIINDNGIGGGLVSASEGTRLFEFGVANFFNAITSVDSPGDPTDVTEITGLETYGDFELLTNYTTLSLLKHNYLGDFGGNPGGDFDSESQLQLVGGLESGGASAGDWGIVTDTDVYLFAVPEPTSALAFLGLFGLAGIKRRRRA